MSNVKTQCKIFKSTFHDVISNNPFAATLMLGNLYSATENAQGEDLDLLQSTLSEAKEKLLPIHVQILWEALTKIPSERLNVMEKTNKAVLQNLKHEIIHDVDIFKHLPASSLVELGQDIEFYREVLVALIRKHISEKQEIDPFKLSSFSYQLLKVGSSEQNSRYLGYFVKQCSSLPLDDIILLGTQDYELAEFILVDLKDSADNFDLGKRFSHVHPELRKEIATTLQNHIDTLPLNSQEKTFCKTELPKLQAQFVEFQNVNPENRVRRDNQVITPSREKSFVRKVCEGTIGGLVSSVAMPAYLAQFGLVFTVPAAVLTIPACISYSFLFNYMQQKGRSSMINMVQPTPTSSPRP